MKMLDMIQTIPGVGRLVDKNIRTVVAKITYVSPEEDPSGHTPSAPAWIVQADAPVPIYQHAPTRKEVIEKTKLYLSSIGFKGPLKIVEADEE